MAPASRSRYQRRMPGLVQDDDAQRSLDLQSAGYRAEDFLRGVTNFGRATGLRRQHELVHVVSGPWREERSAGGHRDRRQRSGKPAGAEVRALQRIDGDVIGRFAIRTQPLAVGEPRRRVLRALAGDHHPLPEASAENAAHRFGGRRVGGLRVAAPRPAGGGQRRRPRGCQGLQDHVTWDAERQERGVRERQRRAHLAKARSQSHWGPVQNPQVGIGGNLCDGGSQTPSGSERTAHPMILNPRETGGPKRGKERKVFL